MIIQLRHSANTGNVPVSLANGELSLNYQDQVLYYQHANGAILQLANGQTLGIGIGIDAYARTQANAAFLTANLATIYQTIAQVSSSANQLPLNTNPYVVTYDTATTLINTAYTIGNTRISVASNGTYRAVASAEVMRTLGGTNNYNFWMWWRKNGVNITNSCIRQTIKNVVNYYSIMNEILIMMSANDYLELVQAIDTTGVSLGLTQSPGLGGPNCPSVVVTLHKETN